MDNLKTFAFNVWTDGKWDMCSIRASREEGAPGLRYIWFVLPRESLESLVSGKTSTAEDGYHKLVIYGDAWTFYDMEYPRDAAGVVQVPYYRAEIPRTFAKVLLRVARWVWRMQRTHGTEETRRDGDKVTLEFSDKHRARICRLYGQGKGGVEWRALPETRERIEALKREDVGFAERLRNIEQIAKNTTRGFHEAASVSISKDLDGFFWSALNPRGRAVLHGGLVNFAAKSGGHDWSIHT